MKYIYRQQTNTSKKHAGDFWISDGINDIAGPFWERKEAESVLKEIEEQETPDIFEDCIEE